MSETMTRECRLWTADLDAQLRKHHAAGLSGGRIAMIMGVTRNSIIGRIHRLGIQRGGQGRTTQRIKRVLKPAMPLPPTVKARPLPPTGLRALVDQRMREKPKPLPVEPDHTGCRVSLLDLEPHQCRWPLGDPRDKSFGFCGADRVQSLPYCAEHARRAYSAGSSLRPIGLPRSLIGRAA